MADVQFDTAPQVYALLNGAWVDLSSYVKVGSIGANWGMSGYRPDDILADIGQMSFTLKNSGGEFYPDGGSAMSGWKTGIQIKIVFTYDGIPNNRFLGYVPREGINLKVGKVSNDSTVEVTALDWMMYANNAPISEPSIELSKTVNEAVDSIMQHLPVKLTLGGDTGTYTFPAVFDSTGPQTTAYTEFSKLNNSESPGRIYLIKHRDSGQALTFENSTHRADTHAQKTTVSLELHHFTNHDGGFFTNHNGGYYTNHQPTESGAVAVTFNSDIDDVNLNYGKNIINQATAIATPKRTDTDPQVLYRLPSPIALAAGETKEIKGRYVEPTGGPTKVSAVISSMLSPEKPGGAKRNLVSLLNFEDSDLLDGTGKHVWTKNDVTIENDNYTDGFGETWITGGVLGSYGVFGGYSAYYISTPSHSDFDFENGAFTIRFFSNIINSAAGNNIMARDMTASYPPWLLGVPDGDDADLGIYLSSNGSSWDIADGKSWGQVNVGRWVHYELGRTPRGFFFAFADGVRTDKWYSATAIPASAGTVSIGRTDTTNYAYMGFDALEIYKGECLHTKDFDPPRFSPTATNEGDYLLNRQSDGSGADKSDELRISAKYFSSHPVYDVTNTSEFDSHLIHLQARGLGVYAYDDIDYSAENKNSIKSEGHQTLTIRQPYQQDLEAGKVWVTDIVADDANPKTQLRGISFWANRTATTMLRFLQCDIGDLVRIVLSDPGIDDYFYIQSVAFSIVDGKNVYVTWGVVQGKEPA